MLTEAEKEQFIAMYMKQYKPLDVFFKGVMYVFTVLILLGLLQSIILDSFEQSAKRIPGTFLALLFILGLNKFRLRFVLGPVTNIQKDNYTLVREYLIAKRDVRTFRQGKRHTYYYYTVAHHQDTKAISQENWIKAKPGDEICILTIMGVEYAIRFE